MRTDGLDTDIYALDLAAGARAGQREADAAALAAPLARSAPAREALPVGELERLVEHRGEFAGVEHIAAGCPVRHRRCWDQVAPAHLHHVDAELARRLVEE